MVSTLTFAMRDQGNLFCIYLRIKVHPIFLNLGRDNLWCEGHHPNFVLAQSGLKQVQKREEREGNSATSNRSFALVYGHIGQKEAGLLKGFTKCFLFLGDLLPHYGNITTGSILEALFTSFQHLCWGKNTQTKGTTNVNPNTYFAFNISSTLILKKFIQ